MITERHLNCALVASVSLTVALAIALATSTGSTEAVRAKPESGQAHPVALLSQGALAQTPPAARKIPVRAGHADWKKLESLSDGEMLRELLARGFSDLLAKNIVLGRIHARYAAARQRLGAEDNAEEKIAARFKLFQQEIEGILGMPWFMERRHQFTEKTMEHAAMDGMRLGHLFPESWELVDRIVGSFPQRWAAVGDYTTARDATLDDLRAAIGEEAFDEFRLRSFSFIFFDVLRPQRVFPTEFADADSRAALRAVMPEDFAPSFYGARHDVYDARRQMIKSLPNVRGVVGDEKFGAFLKLNQVLFERARLSDVTAFEAVKLYDMKRLVQNEAQHLRTEWGLSGIPDDIGTQMFFSLEEAMLQVLGPARYPAYAGRTAEWIEEGAQ